MTNTIKSIYSFIEPYFRIVFVFFCAICFLKIIETVNILSHESIKVFIVVGKCFLNNLIACSFFSLILFPLYLLIRWFSEKAAVFILSFLFAVLLLFEISLFLYSINSGLLLGAEILVRPVSEIIQTIKSSVGIVFSSIIAICCIVGFMFVCILSQKKKFNKGCLLFIIGVIFFASPFVFVLNKSFKVIHKPITNNYIVNKSWYCFKSCANYLQWVHKEKSSSSFSFSIDEHLLEEFTQLFPNRIIPDLNYPLERKNNIENILAPFFQSSNSKPNIIIILVESLGREWSGKTDDNISYTPFLDSLAQHSLYWENCLSTTPRSFGALPTITGSLPFGLKGFQFGDMPAHNTLFSVLKSNGYQTNAFYGGLFYFDCIAEYLIAQKIDYMSESFYHEYEKEENKSLGTFWGYHDHIVFDKTIKVLNSQKTDKPLLNVITTLTMHDPLPENIGFHKKDYLEQARQIANNAPSQTRNTHKKHYQRLAGYLYLDDCIKEFINQYSKRPDFENTIFIITGDHALNIKNTNFLANYHVPLLIWSPQLLKSRYFTSVVTHNDITPSILALLEGNYGLTAQKYVHWLSDGLDTASCFQTQSKMLFLEYAREIEKILYNQYIYFNTDQELLYSINDRSLDIKDNNSKEIKEELRHKLSVFKNINYYVYFNNKLTKHPVFLEEKTMLLLKHVHKDSILCKTLPDKDLEQPRYNLLPDTNLADNNWNKIRLTINADIKILDELKSHEYMDLYFSCTGENMNYPTFYTDKIEKSILTEHATVNTWEKLSMVKEFQVTDANDLKCSIDIYYPRWKENCRVVIKNIEIYVEGIF